MLSPEIPLFSGNTLHGSLTALSLFMLVNSITPGPNNMMLLQGGIKVGFWGCRRQMLGISLGLCVMLWLSYWGMSTFVLGSAFLMWAIKILGTLYLLWLTWQMAKTDLALISKESMATETAGMELSASRPRWQLPLTFWQSAAFQWLNPKAWTMTMVIPTLAVTQGHSAMAGNGGLIALCLIINFCAVSIWPLGGHWIRRLSHHPTLMRAIHTLIVAMTGYCALSLWLPA